MSAPESNIEKPAHPGEKRTHPAQQQAHPARQQAQATAAQTGRTATRAWVSAAAGRFGVTEGTIRRWIRAGRLNPSCGEVYAQVLPYLDRELSTQELKEVDLHIAACPGCEQHFAFDGTVLRFVRQRVPRPLMPANVRARLLAPYLRQAPPEG
jgi:hypothetical protein